MKITTNINVDLVTADETNIPIVEAKQGDSAREIAVHLFAAGSVFTPASIPKIYIKKPDGTLVFNNCSLDGSAIRVPLTTQTLAFPGIAHAELQMTSGDDVLSTPIFALQINPSNIDESAIESSNEFGALLEALATVGSIDSLELRVEALEEGGGGSVDFEPDTSTVADVETEFTQIRGEIDGLKTSMVKHPKYGASNRVQLLNGDQVLVGHNNVTIPQDGYVFCYFSCNGAAQTINYSLRIAGMEVFGAYITAAQAVWNKSCTPFFPVKRGTVVDLYVEGKGSQYNQLLFYPFE